MIDFKYSLEKQILKSQAAVIFSTCIKNVQQMWGQEGLLLLVFLALPGQCPLGALNRDDDVPAVAEDKPSCHSFLTLPGSSTVPGSLLQ